MMEILLKADLKDGSDALEVIVDLPIVPREGDYIEICYESGIEYPVVDAVVLSYNGLAEAWLKFEMYDVDEIRHIMEGAKQEVTP
jgi:hypothetical protein